MLAHDCRLLGEGLFAAQITHPVAHHPRGSTLLGLSDAAEAVGFRTIGARITIEQLLEVPKPCVVHWDQEHFVVCINTAKA